MAKIVITIEDEVDGGGVNASWKFSPKTIRADLPPSMAIRVGQACIGLIHEIAASSNAPAEVPQETKNADAPS